ncbi:hypothetical protein [Sphingomonas sp. Leaf226]|uniref:hypothetical protein n=1 Tax=Sphingomonas sp. Leaf226 TaxID=1735691 RepID=UPI0006FEAD0E|nr:hypothetical protein [Sphingomonas sp. Leaf226]KQM99463.1 hypothetical protein ASE77_00240 [Sphingomonas sp. Leaf226]
MRFTFDWNPDRDPAIKVVGKGAGTLEEWAAAVPMDADDVDPGDTSALINLSDFADDMAVYLTGLRLGVFEGFTEDLIRQQRAHEDAHSPQPILEMLRAKLGVRVGSAEQAG